MNYKATYALKCRFRRGKNLAMNAPSFYTISLIQSYFHINYAIGFPPSYRRQIKAVQVNCKLRAFLKDNKVNPAKA